MVTRGMMVNPAFMMLARISLTVLLLACSDESAPIDAAMNDAAPLDAMLGDVRSDVLADASMADVEEDAIAEDADVGDFLGWPAQDPWPGVVPAVRNRNAPSHPVVAAGRGFGMDGRHAYATDSDPVVLHVTTLASTGPGSLHEHLIETSGPRIIVFDVAGVIDLDRSWNVESGNVWIAGQSAPGLVVLNKGDNSLWLRTGDIFIQHMAFWHSGPSLPPNNRAALRIGSRDGTNFSNIVLDHCFFGGGTDQTLTLYADVQRLTLVDSMVALPRGFDTSRHAFAISAGGNSDNEDVDFVSFIGTVTAHFQERGPQWIVPNGTICNHLVYNRATTGVTLRGKSNETTVFNSNLVGIYERRGANHVEGTTGPIILGRNDGTLDLGPGSRVYIADGRAVEYVDDEWDIVADSNDQEASVRVDSIVEMGWPTGLVAAPNRARSEAEYVELMTRNVGPRPNERAAFIQAVVDDIVASTGEIVDDYPVPAVPERSERFDDDALSHAPGVEAGRTRYEEALLDRAEALLR